MMKSWNHIYNKYDTLVVLLALAVLTFFVYHKVVHHEFIIFDDQAYVTENSYVKRGLSFENIKWAFSLPEEKFFMYWHPVTWLSHMLDIHMFGLDAGRHHLTNLIIHVANALLLFFLLRKMTGSLLRSALVASLFAVHPINVDSVAWIAERKNVLSTFFWISTMLFYYHYTLNPGIVRYAFVCATFILGLLAKPMLVTLPFVLILMDYWPLERIRLVIDKGDKALWPGFRYEGAKFSRLLIEKTPLFSLSMLSIYVSSLSLHRVGNIADVQVVPIAMRIQNALVSYVKYIWKAIYPIDLTFFYPYPSAVQFWEVLGSVLFLLVITALALAYAHKRPSLIVGWLWYLGSFVPALGIVQAGLWPEIAERWAYVPLIGLFIGFAWCLPELSPRMKSSNVVVIAVSALAIILCMALTKLQVNHWLNDFTLYKHGIRINPDNYVAHANLGLAYMKQGDAGKAKHHYEESLRINPMNSNIQTKLGSVYLEEGKYDEAMTCFKTAIEVDPKFVDAYNKMGSLFYNQGEVDEAIKLFLFVKEVEPHRKETYHNLAAAYIKSKDYDKAIQCFQEILRIDPGDSGVHHNLSKILFNQSKIREATGHLTTALSIDPKDPQIHYSLGIVYLSQNRLKEAQKHFSISLESNSHFEQARLQYSSVSKKLCKIHSEIKKLEESLGHGRSPIQIYADLANLYTMSGGYESALNYLMKGYGLSPRDPKICYNIACVYSILGNAGQSITWLDKAFENGFNDFELIENDPDLEIIRETDYYKKIMLEEEEHA